MRSSVLASWPVAGVLLAIVALGGGVGAGCSSQRPLTTVRSDGDRAYELKNYDQAANDYQEYVDRRPQDAKGRYDLGKTLLVLERPRDAREHLIIAFDLDPESPENADALAQAMLDGGEVGAMYTFLRDRAEDQGGVDDYLRLGRFAAKAGDADEAERALKTAAKLDAGRTLGPQMALADFYRSLGDRENAIKRLRMALYIDPTNPDIAIKARELGQVPGPSFAMQPEELE